MQDYGALRYTINNLSPLIFTSKTGDPNMVATLDYIPGSQIRGVFANEYIRRYKVTPEEDEKFRRWFSEGKLHFLNAHVTDSEKRVYSYPVPLNIQIEKYGDKIYNVFFGKDEDVDTKIINSYGYIEDDILLLLSINKSLNFHHKRDRLRGASQEGIIFNYESIDRGQSFKGFIVGSFEDLSKFAEAFPEIKAEAGGIFRIGRSRNTQYGKIQLKLDTNEPLDIETAFGFREISDDEVVLHLISDTVILNNFGFPTVNLSDFERVTGLKAKKSIIKTSVEEGYLSIWKAKTPSYICFKAGSSFLIELEEDSWKILRKLLREGIGEMTYQGFGRFLLFPNEKFEKAVTERDAITIHKPPPPTQFTLRVLEKILEREIEELLRKKAIIDSQYFFKNRPPAASLLAKLEKAVREGKLVERLEAMQGKQAKAKLEECNNGSTTLYEHLLRFEVKLDELLGELKRKPLFSEISHHIPIDALFSDREKLQSRLKESYLLVFLSMLRKREKLIKKSKGGS